MESFTLRALRMPAVSIKIYFCRTPSVSTSKGTSTESRVVPGMGLTMTRSDLVRALIMEDLPTFGRPTIANFSGSVFRTSSVASALPSASTLDSSVSGFAGKRAVAASINASMPSP
jgi:hypothetical protein